MTSLSEDELLEGYSKRLDTLERAAALQAAFMKVLQRVIVRAIAELSKLGAGEAVAQAMADGAAQLSREQARLKSHGYADLLGEIVEKFDTLRSDLEGAGDGK